MRNPLWLTLLLLALLASSCSVQFEKRRYNKGYYVHIASGGKNWSMKSTGKEKQSILEDSIRNNGIPVDTGMLNRDPECDKIVLRDGTVIEAKDIEVGTSKIAYTRCDLATTTTKWVRLRSVEYITLASGKVVYPNKEMASVASRATRWKSTRKPILVTFFLVVGILFLIAAILLLAFNSYGVVLGWPFLAFALVMILIGVILIVAT